MPSMAQGGLRNFTENPNQLNRKFPNHEAKVDPFSRKQKIAQHRKSLPIASVEKRLVDEVRKNDTLIIVGETGSGKTTQLPQFLFNAGFCWDGRTIDHCSWYGTVAQLLGLYEAAVLPKRAIQFGSRIARESNRKNFGSNRAANQASAGSAVIQLPSNLT